MSFWTKVADRPSNTLYVYKKVGGSIFIESDDLVSENQLVQIKNAIWNHHDSRFIKIDMPTIQKSFGSVDEATKYINNI